MTKKTTKALALAAVLTIGAGMMTTFAGCGDSTTTPTESPMILPILMEV